MKNELTALLPFVVNFLIVVCGMVYFTRKPFQRFVYQRYEHLKDSVESAQRGREVIAARLKKVEQSLASFKQDADAIRAQEKTAGTQEAAAIAEKTRAELVRVASDGQRIIENEAKERELTVRSNFVDLITREAEAKLQKNLKREDHSGLIKRASGHIEAKV